ncbi:hypothetical protein CYMTET_51043 [Cymbomonas tetramitiformis]|uniref:Uncharacterized protein n=1 Tax=Cymbomonas tetramitiformis TaxID=36881 RepID=A0AAE0ESU1_9CHLO|nr:hypothetical protein CYMTET_51043 [Cymbomonas tetramitiformis]
MSQLTAKPTPVSRAATSAEFHADPTVWVSTPVKPSQRTEFADKLDYAFSYGEELAKLLRTHGFKSSVGLTLDGPEAESDFAVLLANMAHVFGPVSRDDVAKLLNLDNEYTDYHIVLNELVYAVLPTVLRSTALTPCMRSPWRAIILDETVDPAPQLAAFRTLADKHKKIHPQYSDADMVADLYNVLRQTLSFRAGATFRCCLQKALRRGGGGSGGGGKPTVGSMHALGWKKLAPPVGEWKPVRNARYLQWEGTGLVCVTCFRLWAVTTGHLDAEGVCPYSCSASFAPGRAPATAPTAAPPPPMSAWPPAPPPTARANSLAMDHQ